MDAIATESDSVTLLLAFLLMLLIVGAMSIGVLLGRKPIAGSCGGARALGLDTQCEVCGGNPKACETAERRPMRLTAAQTEAAALGADATRPERSDARTL